MSEMILTVCRVNHVLIPAGWAWREFIHKYPRIPHASVLIIPREARTGHVVMHKRSLNKDVSPGMWDFCGGHVRYEAEVDSPERLYEHLAREAIREGAEEILNVGDLGVTSCEWVRVGRVGELLLDSELNLEFATVFVVTSSSLHGMNIQDDVAGNKVERSAELLEDSYESLRGRFLEGGLRCAEGAAAIFTRFEGLADLTSGSLGKN